MAETDTNLYRSLTGDVGKRFKNIQITVYPGDGVLYPRWEDTQRFSRQRNQVITDQADLTVVAGKDGLEVEPDGGTSLHDVAGWFPNKDFWIPKGTEYCAEEIYIRKDPRLKVSQYNQKIAGHHFQLEPKTRMTVAAFKGALDNMARAAVVKQCELAKTKG
jgi:hypothetical protein